MEWDILQHERLIDEKLIRFLWTQFSNATGVSCVARVLLINFPRNTNLHSDAFSETAVIFSSLSLWIVRGTVIISVGKDHRPPREHWTINSSTKNRIYILDCKLSAVLAFREPEYPEREREREQFAGVFVRVSSTAEYLVVCWTIPIARAGFKSQPFHKTEEKYCCRNKDRLYRTPVPNFPLALRLLPPRSRDIACTKIKIHSRSKRKIRSKIL